MNRRRFMYLAVALVALGSFLWLAGGGMALSQAVISRFFGNSMVRAEVLVQNGGVVQDWRIDRGVITAISGSSITVQERDGTSVTVEVSPTARVQGASRFVTVPQLKRRLRVVLFHQANLPAELVQVETGGGVALSQAVISRFFGNSLVRAEVLVQNGGSVQDWRIDRGVITAISGPSITVQERDGTSVTVEVSPTARVQGASKFVTVPQLKRRLRVVLYHQANLPAELVQVEGAGR